MALIKNKIKPFITSFSIAFLLFGAGLFGYNFYKYNYKTLKESPVDYSDLPKGAADYLILNKERFSGLNMFNTYRWGGYLIWRLYPHYRVFIDGRADLYGDFIGEYYKVMELRPDVHEVLKKYNISLIIIPVNSTLDTYLKEKSSWRQIYSDNTSVIYLRTL